MELITIEQVILVYGLSALAFWRRDTLLYFIAFIPAFFVGVLWFDMYMPAGIASMLLGGLLIFKAFYQIARGGVRF
jgi:hypothetical protein